MDPQSLIGKVIKSRGVVQRRILGIYKTNGIIKETVFISEWTRDNFQHITPEKIPLWYLEELLKSSWSIVGCQVGYQDEEML